MAPTTENLWRDRVKSMVYFTAASIVLLSVSITALWALDTHIKRRVEEFVKPELAQMECVAPYKMRYKPAPRRK